MKVPRNIHSSELVPKNIHYQIIQVLNIYYDKNTKHFVLHSRIGLYLHQSFNNDNVIVSDRNRVNLARTTK